MPFQYFDHRGLRHFSRNSKRGAKILIKRVRDLLKCSSRDWIFFPNSSNKSILHSRKFVLSCHIRPQKTKFVTFVWKKILHDRPDKFRPRFVLKVLLLLIYKIYFCQTLFHLFLQCPIFLSLHYTVFTKEENHVF